MPDTGIKDRLLDQELWSPVADEPPTQLGVWLESYQPLTVMVDITGLRVLPESSPSTQFIGWLVADPDGRPPDGAARDLIVQLCEYSLHLDGVG
jgi:hypothetical protein